MNTVVENATATVTAGSLALNAWHRAGWPVALKLLSRGAGRGGTAEHLRPEKRPAPMTDTTLDTALVSDDDCMPAAVAFAKRGFDIAVALFGILLTAPLWPLLALAIRLDSPGPVFFRQLRVGRVGTQRTELFEMWKFRSMRSDAEKACGAVWASKRDPRVTRIGHVLRRTRLDELPQLVNVLKGDMSIVGPRPERPGFYRKLERAIPFFAERTCGLRPGITGFAQVRQGYDTCIDDVRRKVGFDHAYAMRLTSLRAWFVTDIGIVIRTAMVMIMGRGQ